MHIQQNQHSIYLSLHSFYKTMKRVFAIIFVSNNKIKKSKLKEY